MGKMFIFHKHPTIEWLYNFPRYKLIIIKYVLLNRGCYEISAEVILLHCTCCSTKHGRDTKSIWNQREDDQSIA